SFLFCFLCYVPHRHLPSFPTRRSSDLSSIAVRTSSSLYPPTCRNWAAIAPAPSGRKRRSAKPMLRNSWFVSNSVVTGPVRSEKRSEEHTSELQSRENLVCRLLLEKKKK